MPRTASVFPDTLRLDPVDTIDSNSECDSTNLQSSLPGVTPGLTPTCVVTCYTDYEMSDVSPTITEVSQSLTHF